MSEAHPDRIEKKILLQAPRSRVWRALTDSSEFGHWFGVKFDGPFTPGRAMRGVMVGTRVDAAVAAAQQPYNGEPFEITIERIVPEHLFSFRWHPSTEKGADYSSEPTTLVEFALEEVSSGRDADGHRIGVRPGSAGAPGEGVLRPTSRAGA